jgi:Flp pilus assembly protein TadD
MNGGDFVTRALIATNQIKDAVALAQAISEMLPSESRAHNLYGAALSVAGDNKTAMREYTKAKEVFKAPVRDPNEKFPQVDDTWYFQDQLVRTLLELNKAAAAVPLAQALAELYPDNARAHDTFGLVLAQTGRKSAAAAAFARALSIDPRETRAMEHQRLVN